MGQAPPYGEINPTSRRNEVISKLKSGVEDLSISRQTLTWGIPLPNDPSHVIYVWIDALSNYITALGYGQDDDSKYRKYWPADVHLIGKEIMWFHPGDPLMELDPAINGALLDQKILALYNANVNEIKFERRHLDMEAADSTEWSERLRSSSGRRHPKSDDRWLDGY